MTEGEKW